MARSSIQVAGTVLPLLVASCTGVRPPQPVPTPTPAPTIACAAPQGIEWRSTGSATTSLRPVVVKVLEELSGCQAGSDCPVPDNLQGWQARVVAALRTGNPPRSPLCAGQHENGVTDEIAVATPDAGSQPGVPWEGYRVGACTPPRPGEPATLDTCAIPGRIKVRWAFPTPAHVPAAGGRGHPAPPAPTPAPAPPTPRAGACPLQLPLSPGYSLGLRLARHGPQQVDATPYVQGDGGKIPPDGWTGVCRARQCDLAPEKDHEHGAACSTELCGPAPLDYSVDPPDVGTINWREGFRAKVTIGEGRTARVRACCPVSGVCGELELP